MRIWLIGADATGIKVIRQLRKNQDVELIVSASQAQPRAVSEGVLKAVDYVETVTSLNVNQLARRVRPDLILIDSGAGQRNLSRVTGGSAFSEALSAEIASASDHPCLVL